MNCSRVLQTKKVNEQKISLFTILSCHLCSNKAVCAHICPNCSKFYCENCIKDWIKNGHCQCPNCKCYLNQGIIVNCTKLSLDLSNALQSLIHRQAPHEIQCKIHDISQIYYCEDCHISICSDCIVLESNHKNHSISKIKKIKTNFNEQVLLLMAKIRKSMKEVQKMKQQLNPRKANRNQQKKEKIEILDRFMKTLKHENQSSINLILAKLESCLDNNNLIQASGQKVYQQFLHGLKVMSKISLVRSKPEELEEVLSTKISEIDKNFIQKQQLKKISNKDQIVSMVGPKLAKKTFILYNYSQFRQKKQVIYSDSFFDGVLEWRLKIYPNGLSNPQNSQNKSQGQEYISIYIELVSGVREGGRYKFNIEILNQNQESFGISQIYEECFDSGKCWGYDQFANIGTLYQKGYVDAEEDSIKISVCVGTPSYYYAVLDQQAIISKTQNRVSQNTYKINQLKQKLQSQTNIISNKTQIQTAKTLPTELHSFSHVTTPRCKLAMNQQTEIQKSIENDCQFMVDFENYTIKNGSENESRNLKSNDDFDYQSGELSKIYRRLSGLVGKEKLLMF